MGIIVACSSSKEISEEKVREIHHRALTVDTHCDTPMNLLNTGFDIGLKNEVPRNRVDFPRMKEGGLDAIFFAAFTGNVNAPLKISKLLIIAPMK